MPQALGPRKAYMDSAMEELIWSGPKVTECGRGRILIKNVLIYSYYPDLMTFALMSSNTRYSRTPDERPPSPTTIPLIRPHFV